jgi:hypothetical protein
MENAWLQERPHLAELVQSMQTVLELADELYERGRSSGESVDYSAFEERVGHAAAEVERASIRLPCAGSTWTRRSFASGASTIAACTGSRVPTRRLRAP